MFTSLQHPDRYGYYQIGNRRTYSKLEFVDYLNQYPADWHWDYNDAFFSSFDWATEPAEDINTLYRKRAEALREQYDYVVLFYSGGYDSSNMLYAFLDNGIPIDEICTYYASQDTFTGQKIELDNFTWQKLDAIEKKYPNIKITRWDYGDEFFNWSDKIKQAGAGANMLEMIAGGLISINRIVLAFGHEYVPHWKKLLMQGKKVAWVHGADKPMLRYHNDTWKFNFHDGIINGRLTPVRQILDQGDIGNIELFYWAPDATCANIIIKQCHLLKNYYTPQAKIDFSKIPGVKKHNIEYGWEIDNISLDFVKQLYPRLFSGNLILPNENWSTIKSARSMFGNRDHWFTQLNHHAVDEFHRMWKGANSSIHSHWHDWFHNGTIESGIRSCITQDYII